MKWCGVIGYVEKQVETSPGVYTDRIIERKYYGEIRRPSHSYQSSETLNDDINVTNEISIVADPFTKQNSHLMKYVEFMGAKWKISKVELQHPRLILTVGGVYNGKQA